MRLDSWQSSRTEPVLEHSVIRFEASLERRTMTPSRIPSANEMVDAWFQPGNPGPNPRPALYRCLYLAGLDSPRGRDWVLTI